MSGIGEFVLDYFVGFDVTLYRPATDDTVTIYVSNKSWMTRPNDTIAANRQYKGLVLNGIDFTYSWFQGDRVGGLATRNYGKITLANPDGVHSLDYIFAGAYSVQGRSIVCRMGQIGDDLAAMYRLDLQGREIRPTADGWEVEIDLADETQAFEGSIFLPRDRFKGLDYGLRHGPAVASTIPSSAAYDPSTGPGGKLFVQIHYRLNSGIAFTDWLRPLRRLRDTGGDVAWTFDFHQSGYSGATGKSPRIAVRDASDVAFSMVCNDLTWVDDDRVHSVAFYWNGATIYAYHSTLDGGITKSATTLTVGSIRSGLGQTIDLGDTQTRLATNDYAEIVELRIAVDTAFTDAVIYDRFNRTLTADEIADYESVHRFDEAVSDETGNGHTATKHASATYEPTFEGTPDQAGSPKPLAFGRIPNAPMVWANEAKGQAVVHARRYLGALAVWEGGKRLEIGWPRRRFFKVQFIAASNQIKLPTRTDSGANSRLDAQPCFGGLIAGQHIVITGTASNNATRILASDSTEDTITVTTGIVDEGPGAESSYCFIEALDRNGNATDVELWHDSGGILFNSIPRRTATAQLLGDIGKNDNGAGSSSVHFPDYVSGLIQRIIGGWSNVTLISPIVEYSTPSAVAQAGDWLNPSSDVKVLDVLSRCAASAWMRWGPNPATSGQWSFLSIVSPPGVPALSMTEDNIIALRRLRSVDPVLGVVLRGAHNRRVLDAGDLVGAATVADRQALTRPYIEKPSVGSTIIPEAYPFADMAQPVDVWLVNPADIQAEADRRFAIIGSKLVVYELDAVLYGVNQNPLSTEVSVTDETFGALTAGANFWMVQIKVKDELVTQSLWGSDGG